MFKIQKKKLLFVESNHSTWEYVFSLEYYVWRAAHYLMGVSIYTIIYLSNGDTYSDMIVFSFSVKRIIVLG